MTIVKIDPQVAVPLRLINNRDVSALAFGVYCYMARPEDAYGPTTEAIMARFPESRSALKKAIAELVAIGVITEEEEIQL